MNLSIFTISRFSCFILIIDKGTLVAEDTPEHLSEDFSDTDSIILSVKGDKEKVEKVLKASE